MFGGTVNPGAGYGFFTYLRFNFRFLLLNQMDSNRGHCRGSLPADPTPGAAPIVPKFAKFGIELAKLVPSLSAFLKFRIFGKFPAIEMSRIASQTLSGEFS